MYRYTDEQKQELTVLMDMIAERDPSYLPETPDPTQDKSQRERILEEGLYLSIFTRDTELLISSLAYGTGWRMDRYVREGFQGVTPCFPLSVECEIGELVATVFGEIRSSEGRSGTTRKITLKIRNEVASLNRIASRPYRDKGAVRDRWAFG